MRFVCLWNPGPGGTTMLSAPYWGGIQGRGCQLGVQCLPGLSCLPGTQAAVTLQLSEPECGRDYLSPAPTSNSLFIY